jgi:hypothetical protein
MGIFVIEAKETVEGPSRRRHGFSSAGTMQSDVTTKHTKHTKVGPYGRNQMVFLVHQRVSSSRVDLALLRRSYFRVFGVFRGDLF